MSDCLLKGVVFWDFTSCRLVINDVSERPAASVFKFQQVLFYLSWTVGVFSHDVNSSILMTVDSSTSGMVVQFGPYLCGSRPWGNVRRSAYYDSRKKHAI